jgi:hypothetical protein
MAYAFTQDLPINKDMYLGITDQIGDEAPKGLIVHLAFETATGMRNIDVWEREEDFDRFAEERLHPIIEKMLQSAGLSREAMGAPEEQELKAVEIFGAGIPKRKLF